MENEVKKSLRDFVTTFTNITNLEDDDELFGNRAINSLFAMELVLFVERKFDLRLKSEDLKIENFRSINSISRLVATLLVSSVDQKVFSHRE